MAAAHCQGVRPDRLRLQPNARLRDQHHVAAIRRLSSHRDSKAHGHGILVSKSIVPLSRARMFVSGMWFLPPFGLRLPVQRIVSVLEEVVNDNRNDDEQLCPYAIRVIETNHPSLPPAHA
eukprot:70449-Rhodomonas_salina.1